MSSTDDSARFIALPGETTRTTAVSVDQSYTAVTRERASTSDVKIIQSVAVPKEVI